MGIPRCFPKGRGGHSLGQAPEGQGHLILWRGRRGMPERLCLGSIPVQRLPSQGLVPRAWLSAMGQRGVRLHQRSPGQEKGIEQGSRGAGHNPGIFGPGVGAAVPSGGWADLGFLQQGRVMPCGGLGLVPHTWRSQLNSWELRVPPDTTHGHGAEWQGALSQGTEGGGETVQAHSSGHLQSS